MSQLSFFLASPVKSVAHHHEEHSLSSTKLVQIKTPVESSLTTSDEEKDESHESLM